MNMKEEKLMCKCIGNYVADSGFTIFKKDDLYTYYFTNTGTYVVHNTTYLPWVYFTKKIFSNYFVDLNEERDNNINTVLNS